MSKRNFLLFLATSILVLSLVSAGNYVALQGSVKQSGVGISTGDLKVYIFDNATAGDLIYNSTTDFDGVVVNGTYDVLLGSGSNELVLDYGKRYYLEMFVNNEIFSFDGSQRQVFESAVGNVTYLHLSPNIPTNYINKTAGTNWVGIDLESILDTIYSWIGAVNTTENIIDLGFNTTAQLDTHYVLKSDQNKSNVNDSEFIDGYDSSFFMPLNTSVSGDFDFNGGWTGGGLSIAGGNLFAQTIYVYNLSSLAVNKLNVNGSIIPQAPFDNLFDLGSASLRWKNMYLGGQIYSNGTGNNYFAGNVGIGTGSLGAKLQVVSNGIINTYLEDLSSDTTLTLIQGGNAMVLYQKTTGDAEIDTTGNLAMVSAIGNITLNGNVLHVGANGNVGIGTNNPKQKLNVIGNANITGNLTVGGNWIIDL